MASHKDNPSSPTPSTLMPNEPNEQTIISDFEERNFNLHDDVGWMAKKFDFHRKEAITLRYELINKKFITSTCQTSKAHMLQDISHLINIITILLNINGDEDDNTSDEDNKNSDEDNSDEDNVNQ